MMNSRPEGFSIVSSVVLALAVAALVAVGAYRQAVDNAEASRLVRTTYEAIEQLDAALSLALDVETGARGYVITGQDSYLGPFETGTREIGPTLQRLRRLVADVSEQQHRLDALETLTARAVEVSRTSIELRRTAGRTAAETHVYSGEGLRTMDALRRVHAELSAMEHGRLRIRTAALRASQDRTFEFYMVLVAGLGVLLLVALVLVRRNAAVHRQEVGLIEAARTYAQGIVDSVGDALVVLDDDLRVQSANRSFYEIFGLTPRETEGARLYGLAGGQWNIPALHRLLDAAVREDTVIQEVEIEHDFPGLGRRILRLSVRRLRPAGRGAHSLVLAIENATERKASEEERQRVFSLSRDLICVATLEGYFIRVNPAWERLLGYPVEELLSRPFLEFVHPDDRDATLAEIAALSEGLETVAFENRYRCSDGSYRWLLWNATPSLARASIYAVAHDISERKQAEAALHDSHAALQGRFEAAIRASGQLLHEWNADTDLVSYGNADAALGYIEADLQGGMTRWVELIHPEDRQAFLAAFDRAVRSGRPLHCEYRVLRKDGEYLPVEHRGYHTADPDGRVTGTIGFVGDVSERQNLEEQFRQAQKMEAIGRLAGGIAHDFNNLLCVVLGFTDLLRDRIGGDEAAAVELDEIRRAADSAAMLTRQLLAFSRKQVLEPRELDLNELIAGQTKMLHRLIGEDIRLVTVTGPDLGRVRADAGQIEQVLLNLVVNARDAMPQGGALTIETANVDLDDAYADAHVAVEPGRYVMVAVSDTGPGMDAATQKRIFEPFFTTKTKGTGLGLSTVYGIVKQSGGHIWVYSELGQGTTFKIYLPGVDTRADATSAIVQRPTAPPGSETILLVEDSEPLRAVARRFLEGAGYTVLEAPDSASAIDMAALREVPLDLLLTDVVMPEMSGREVASQVMERHPNMKVLYMSGYTDEAVVHHGVLAEGVSLLPKPFSREGLLTKVRCILDS